ncbi:fimbrillin family protein [Parabacteroides distasonis]|uniref:fimbrillin family protein n=1 Tax=Parabacteroides distasonis TaxID=823 RepID=UPI001C3852C1|nr:fimbrillin family protein [Parabacteroides distasonis]MBV4224493.1 fimbrillin family protein [Parabacteroides distasonis]
MRKLINYKLLFLSPFFLAACSNEDNIPSILPSNQPDAVELGITAGVTLTKSVINLGTQADASKDDVMKSVAVYARLKGTVVSGEDPYTNAKSNNYALYTYSTTGTAGWKSGDKKIYLTSEVAKIYAYYPAYQPGTNQELATTTALVLSDNTATDNSTIPVTVFAGTTDDAHRDYPSTLIDNSETTNTNKAKINSAKGEIDYMWADQGSSETNWITASNTKKETSIDASVDLTMKHALTLVSFRIYNDGTYKNKGVLLKIQLKDVPNQKVSGNSNPLATMNIDKGTLANNSSLTTGSYIREFATGATYTLKKKGDSGLSDDNAAKGASYRFSILALPITSKALNNTKAIFTIDGADYEVALADSGTGVTWEQGKENIYTVKLSGKELSIGTVTVAAWGTGTGNDDLKVN